MNDTQKAKVNFFFLADKPMDISVINRVATEMRAFKPVQVVYDVNELQKKVVPYSENFIFIVSHQLTEELKEYIVSLRNNLDTNSVVLAGMQDVAYDAWQLSCFDFLSLPISLRDLKRSFRKYQNLVLRVKPDPIKVRTNDGWELLGPEDVLFLRGDGNYTTIHLVNKRKITITKRMKEVETFTEGYSNFIKIKRGLILNFANIKGLAKKKGGKQLVFIDGTTYPVSGKVEQRIRLELFGN